MAFFESTTDTISFDSSSHGFSTETAEHLGRPRMNGTIRSLHSYRNILARSAAWRQDRLQGENVQFWYPATLLGIDIVYLYLIELFISTSKQ
jgi:hypothetical protein